MNRKPPRLSKAWQDDLEIPMAIDDIYNAILTLNLKEIAAKVQAELDSGGDVQQILNRGLIAPLDEVGRRFSAGELFMPEMLRAANTMKKGLEVLRPHLENADDLSRGTVVLGTVKGDLHDIGKNLVGMMLEGGGYKVIDLGVDAAADKFIAAVGQSGARVVGLSALLTTTMPAMRSIIEAIRAKGLAVKVMVGGAPVTQSFAEEIGADGYGHDAPSAVALVRSFL
jgi:5-methyltetrahydrofolate--homocysteine methyltransferase